MVTSAFRGFPPEALTFFRQLEKNNTRDWFQWRKEIYEQKVKAPTVEFATAINAELQRFAPDYVTDPKKAIFRIYRDTRFSKDKAPYKLHSGVLFSRRGTDKDRGGGLYVSISHKSVSVAGGVYDPDAKVLLAIRAHLSTTYEELERLLKSPSLRKLAGELKGDSLTRMPKGFPPGHPAEALLRRKAWYFFVNLEPELALSPKLLPEVVKRFRAMAPVVEHLCAPLLGKKKFDVTF